MIRIGGLAEDNQATIEADSIPVSPQISEGVIGVGTSKLRNIITHRGFRRYFSNTSWLFAGKIARMAVGLTVGALVARYLQPEKFGTFSYAQSFVVLFSAFAAFGLDGITVRELVKTDDKRDELLGTVFVLKLIGAFLTLALLLIGIQFIDQGPLTKILIFIIASATIFQSFNVIDFYFRSKILSKYFAYSTLTNVILFSLVKLYLIYVQAQLIWFAVVIAADALCLALGLIYFYKKNHFSISSWRFNKVLSKKLIAEGSPIMISGAITAFCLSFDKILIGHYATNSDVGIYAVCVRLSTAAYFIPVIISTSFSKFMVSADKARLTILYSTVLYASLLILVTLLLFGDSLINVLFGNSYSYAYELLKIHIIALPFIFYTSIRKKRLILSGNSKYVLRYNIFNFIVIIALYYILIPAFGPLGAAIAYTATWILNVLLAPVFSRRFREDSLMFIEALYIKRYV